MMQQDKNEVYTLVCFPFHYNTIQVGSHLPARTDHNPKYWKTQRCNYATTVGNLWGEENMKNKEVPEDWKIVFDCEIRESLDSGNYSLVKANSWCQILAKF